MRLALAILVICASAWGQAFTVNDPAWMGQQYAAASVPASSWSPTNISGMAYFWTVDDISTNPPNGSISNWIDRIQGTVYSMEAASLRPVYNGHGVYFSGDKLTNANGTITIPTNSTFWIAWYDCAGASRESLFADDVRNYGFYLSLQKLNYYNNGSGFIASSALDIVSPKFQEDGRAHWVAAGGYHFTNGVYSTNLTAPKDFTGLRNMGKDPSYTFIGTITHIGIWTNNVLTTNDALALYSWANTNDGINVTSGLLAWWKLDEGSGGTVADSSGNGWTGYLSNSPAWTNGQISSALSFNGAPFGSTGNTNYVLFPGTTNVANTNLNLTISLWFKTPFATNASDPKVVLSKVAKDALLNDSRYPGWEVHYDDAALSTYFTDGTNILSGGYTSAAASDGRWHHYAAVRDSTGTNLFQYLDGSFQNVGYNYQGTNMLFSSTNNIMIGWNFDEASTPSTKFMFGQIDDVRIFGRALSSAEVHSLYKWGWYVKSY